MSRTVQRRELNNYFNFVTDGAETKQEGQGEEEKKVIDFSELLQELENSQWKGLQYTYEVEPQSNNLFYAGYFAEGGNPNNLIKPFYNAPFRIKSVNIPFPSLEVEYNMETRAPFVKGANFENEVTIDWFEDVYHSVQKYHIDWFNRWYSREHDCFRCGVIGKFRKMMVIGFHYVNGADPESTQLFPVPKIEPLFAFVLGGLIPKRMPPIKFDYNADGNETLVSMTYGCNVIRWLFTAADGIGDLYFTDKKKVDVLYDYNDAKIPEEAKDMLNDQLPDENLYSFDKYKYEDNNTEKLRILRSTTFFQTSESSLG